MIDMNPRAHKILIIEDEQTVRVLFGRVLRKTGYDVFEAADGAEAVRIAEGARDIDLVVSDVVMPGLSGPDTVAKLAVLIPALRVLYVSGYTRDTTFDAGTRLDTNVNFLQKPVSPSTLVMAVADMLALGHLSADLKDLLLQSRRADYLIA